MDKPDVTFDADDGAWVATRGGEELGRNHVLGPDNTIGARKWLAWLTGDPVPQTEGEARALGEMMATSGLGVGSAAAMVLAAIAGQPGLLTDEYLQWNDGMLAAVACTSLDDDQALERARSCPSGTSGGWVRSSRVEPVPCEKRPDHRHILFEAG